MFGKNCFNQIMGVIRLMLGESHLVEIILSNPKPDCGIFITHLRMNYEIIGHVVSTMIIARL